MATGNPYSRMVTRMREAGSYHNGFDLEQAEVISVHPLQIRYNNVPIADGIISSYSVGQDGEDILQAIRQEENLSEGLKQYLTGLYDMFYLSEGDMVMVQRVNDTFYIVGKAV